MIHKKRAIGSENTITIRSFNDDTMSCTFYLLPVQHLFLLITTSKTRPDLK
jgi:hypothetical protein